MAESARGKRRDEFTDESPTPLTPTDIRNAQFGTTRLRSGYDMDEVDAFLDMVEERLAVLYAELQRAQEGQSQYRAQYEQLRARLGSAASTAVVRPESPQPSQDSPAQAVAQALVVRQALIAQLREHVTQVQSQIRTIQASLDTPALPQPSAVTEPANTDHGPPSAVPEEQSQAEPLRPTVPRARGPMPIEPMEPIEPIEPLESTQELRMRPSNWDDVLEP